MKQRRALECRYVLCIIRTCMRVSTGCINITFMVNLSFFGSIGRDY